MTLSSRRSRAFQLVLPVALITCGCAGESGEDVTPYGSDNASASGGASALESPLGLDGADSSVGSGGSSSSDGGDTSSSTGGSDSSTGGSSATVIVSSQPGDCSSTAECQQEYPGATDCKNSEGGVCYCGSSICTTETTDDGGGTVGDGTMLGKFEIGTDLLLCNYDQKPDEDDIHAVAGLATMLHDSRFAGVDYHCTAGAYGQQGATFIDEPTLFNMAFGSNWANADSNWNAAVDTAFGKAKAVLNAGGDIWVTEAGQSDFTADVVRKVKAEMSGIDTSTRIHVVQHSDWNENNTTPADLTYTKNNTDYHKIDDGNGTNNTPNLHTSDGSQWSRAKSDADVGAIWTEAQAAAERWFGVNWDNDAIVAGGMDFSDTVEPMWIFGFAEVSGGVKGFFDEFL